MKKEWTEEELKQVARQLSQPKGDAGIKTAERMALSNENMIARTVESLRLEAGEKVLEIGPGNGSHVAWLMDKATGLSYTGADISMTMIEEANRINDAMVSSGSVSFELSDGEHLDFPADAFQKIFTVNTLYFWKDPRAYATEIYKVLKPGGRFCTAFATKELWSSCHLPNGVFSFILLPCRLSYWKTRVFILWKSPKKKTLPKVT